MKLWLLEPEDPGTAWAPFTGVRPVAELRAGVWTVRERWEAALDTDTAAILGAHVAGFHEFEGPPCTLPTAIPGPAVVAEAAFAPTGRPITLGPGTRRLTHAGETIAWVVLPGEAWTGRHAAGEALEVDGRRLHGTFDLVTALEHYLPADCLGFSTGPVDPVPAGSLVLGDPGLVLCREGLVEPGVVFDTRLGAIVLDGAVEVRHGTRLEGPLYAGERSRLLGGDIRASMIGPRCNVRGEVTHSLFLGYANKSHEGFVGHSVVGHWVNLGALTTTSNLKNTYGEVRLPGRADDPGGRGLATGRQFLGSLIGDHVKTAIGTLLSTGTVVGAGANLFGATPPPRRVPPMAWGSHGTERLTEEGFLRVAERVMPRRDVPVTPERRASLTATYRRVAGG